MGPAMSAENDVDAHITPILLPIWCGTDICATQTGARLTTAPEQPPNSRLNTMIAARADPNEMDDTPYCEATRNVQKRKMVHRDREMMITLNRPKRSASGPITMRPTMDPPLKKVSI